MQKNRLIALITPLTFSAALAMAAGADQTPQATENTSPAATAAAPAAPGASTEVAPGADGPAKTAPAARRAVHKGGGGGVGPRPYASLNLTEAQRQQVDAIEKQFRADNKALFASLAELRARTREARAKDDQAALEALEAAKKSKRAEMARATETRDKKIAAVLTPEQRNEWQSFKSERQKVRKQQASAPPKQ